MSPDISLNSRVSSVRGSDGDASFTSWINVCASCFVPEFSPQTVAAHSEPSLTETAPLFVVLEDERNESYCTSLEMIWKGIIGCQSADWMIGWGWGLMCDGKRYRWLTKDAAD